MTAPARPGITTRPAPGSGTLAAGRVADVLLAVADSPEPVGVSAVGRRLGLSKAVVHRMLRSLADRQLIAPGPRRGTYRLGPAAAVVGARALASLDVRAAALPRLRELQSETGETATVSVVVGSRRTYVDQVIGHGEIRMTVELGTPYPLHAGSSGKAILAFARAELVAWVLGASRLALTERTITDRDALEAELRRVRRDGFASAMASASAERPASPPR